MAMQKKSRKRDAILACVCSTDTHPTAEWVYTQLKPDIPDLSLGTVYRNLAMFRREGIIGSAGVVNGLERYDRNPLPHAHFVCTQCSGNDAAIHRRQRCVQNGHDQQGRRAGALRTQRNRQ